MSTARRRSRIVAASALMLALSGAAWWAVSGSKGGPKAPSPAHEPVAAAGTTGFVDAIESSGITFRMSFLPEEQGEHFKINLYDHGCGVAVADFDGDGLDDLYFCNQLAPRPLRDDHARRERTLPQPR